ncbi:MAG: methyl-accepting chemotaxis protein [candidate division Zixibacteria bacterium]|nr:methyl-accepting chemotaxis protein [candidate division Zixibacteria bacterium]
MIKNMKMGMKLIIIFLLIGLMPMVIISWLTLSKSRIALEEKTNDQLTFILDVKAEKITNYFNKLNQDLAVLSKTGDVVIAFRSLNAYYEDMMFEPTDPYDISTSDYKEIYTDKGTIFKEYMREYGFEDLLLIHGEYGHVMYSGKMGKDAGTNLSAGEYKNSILAQLWKNVVDKNEFYVTDIGKYEPLDGKPAMFAGSPIIDGRGNVIGMTAIQINLNHINRLIQETAGDSKTIRSYLVGHDGILRSELNTSQDGSILGRKIEFSSVEEALAGKSGSHLTDDFVGESVLSAYAPLSVGNNDWAILTDIAASDAFAGINEIRNYIIILGLILAVVVAVAGSLFSRVIINPVSKMVEAINKFAQNDLTYRVEIDSKDELGQMARVLNDAIDTLHMTVSRINDSTERVAGAARGITTLSDQLSAGVKHQTDQTAQVSVAMEEMAATITETTKNTTSVAEKAQDAASRSQDGSRLAEDTSRGMDSIVSATEITTSNVQNLAEKANEIGEIIRVINDIADQTNLLALNAAIEAARAGEQGRGFAVVADEVRKLAERTTQATQEVADTIKGIQADVSGTNTQIEEARELVGSGKELVEKTNVSLNEIYTSIEDVQDMIRQIATASEEQSSAADEISKNVENVDKVSQDSSSNASEAAKSAEELKNQAEELRSLVGGFKLE